MTVVRYNQETGDFDLVDSRSGFVVDSVCERSAAQHLADLYNDDEE